MKKITILSFILVVSLAFIPAKSVASDTIYMTEDEYQSYMEMRGLFKEASETVDKSEKAKKKELEGDSKTGEKRVVRTESGKTVVVQGDSDVKENIYDEAKVPESEKNPKGSSNNGDEKTSLGKMAEYISSSFSGSSSEKSSTENESEKNGPVSLIREIAESGEIEEHLTGEDRNKMRVLESSIRKHAGVSRTSGVAVRETGYNKWSASNDHGKLERIAAYEGMNERVIVLEFVNNSKKSYSPNPGSEVWGSFPETVEAGGTGLIFYAD